MLASIPHFDQWLGDWAMEPERFVAGYQSLLGLNLTVHLKTGPKQAQKAAEQQAQLQLVAVGPGSANGGADVGKQQIAIVGLYGPLMKSVPSSADGTSTVLARRKIRAAMADPDVAGIMLHIDSPGGTVAGTEALATDVAAAAKRKPVYAYVEDLGASAAYWIASQAGKIFAGPSSLVGSIGTYGVVYDLSGKAAMQGVKVHVVRAGEMKGAGEPGTEISPQLLSEVQKRVEALNEFFVRGVAAGRGLSLTKARDLADGRIHIAAEAQSRGLIDGIGAFDDSMSQLARAASQRKSSMNASMTEAVAATAVSPDTTVAAGSAQQAPPPASGSPRAATLPELRAALPQADADFLLAQIEAGATLAQAKANFDYVSKLNARHEAARQQSPPKKPGVSVNVASGSDDESQLTEDDPLAVFGAQIEQLTAKGMTRMAAVDVVRKKHPDLAHAYLLAINADKPAAQRVLRETRRTA